MSRFPLSTALVAAAAVLVIVIQPLPSHAERLNVGTYNIRTSSADHGTTNAWTLRRGEVAALVRRLDLDIVGFQEAMPGQVAFLRGKLPEYAVSGLRLGAGGKGMEGNPVFFRTNRLDLVSSGTFWLSETPDVPGSKSWNTACVRTCSWAVLKDKSSGATLCFANVHTDHKSRLAREKGMELVVQRLPQIAPEGASVILVGDHNCRENAKAAQIAAASMRDAIHASKTPPKGPWRSFTAWRWLDKETPAAEALKVDVSVRNAFAKTAEGDRLEDGVPVFLKYGSRIDYVYVSEGVEVLSYETHADSRPGEKRYPSDHFPVTAEIELPPIRP